MRKYLLLLLISLNFLAAKAQIDIEVVEPKEKPVLIGKVGAMSGDIQCLKYESNNMYVFVYRDVKFTHIDETKSFSFYDEDGDFDKLHDIILSYFDNPPQSPVKVKIPKGYIWINATRLMGTTSINIGHSVLDNGEVVGYSRWMSKKQVNKLFGKL